MYPDISSGKVRCICEQDCKALFYSGNMCLTSAQCSGLSCYGYLNGSRRQCTDVGQCRREGGHVYRAEWACLKIPADTSNNGFLARFNNENFYECIPDYFLRIDKDAKCIPKSECKRFR